VDISRVRFLVAAGRIPAEKIGGVWVIKQSDLDAFERTRVRHPGRPRKLRPAYGSGEDRNIQPSYRRGSATLTLSAHDPPL
jgi:hypothetical protein